MWDYDIAIAGATPGGLSAARQAAAWGARVALVGLPEPASVSESIFATCCDRARNWEEAWLQADLCARALAQEASPEVLAIAGVDWVAEPGTFESPDCLRTQHRNLQARHYLLMPSLQPHLPDIAGLGAAGFCRLQDLPAASPRSQHWTVLGDDPAAIAWAQQLARWGKTVTLAVRADRLLSNHADREVAVALQRLVEADGVRVYLEAPIRVVRARADGGKDLETARATWSAEEILVVDGLRPHWQPWNLAAAGVAVAAGAVRLDRQLRTSNRRIYAGRTWLGADVARQDATTILQKILGRSPLLARAPRSPVPYWVRTTPTFARVGLSATGAESRWPGRVRTAVYLPQQQARFVLDDATSGLCHIVARQDGLLLGVEILAVGAEDLVALAAMALRQRLTLANLVTLAAPELSRTQLLLGAAHQWQRQHRRLPKT